MSWDYKNNNNGADVENVDTINLPVLIRTRQSSKVVSIYSPDLHVTVHGKDYVTAWTEAQAKFGAIYFYSFERNIRYKIKTDLSEVNKLCKVVGDFPTFLPLTPS